MSTRETPLIFLSCGQCRDEEKALGQQVKELLEGNGCVEVYFAENQTTFEAFTKNILSALNRCVGFIGMQHRGEVRTPTGSITRASVWVEHSCPCRTPTKHESSRVDGSKRPLKMNGLRPFSEQ
jgi:hypothetical protein